jgi:hypothetical protein
MRRIFGGSYVYRSSVGALALRAEFKPGRRSYVLSLRLARSPMQQAQKGVRDE